MAVPCVVLLLIRLKLEPKRVVDMVHRGTQVGKDAHPVGLIFQGEDNACVVCICIHSSSELFAHVGRDVDAEDWKSHSTRGLHTETLECRRDDSIIEETTLT